jgi:hypothetical protein
MASEETKKANQYRLASMALTGLASGVWDTLGDSAFAFSGPMGRQILGVMEKEMGLEIAGENPEDVLAEIGRIFVDEFGFASDITVERKSPDVIELKVHNCINRNYTDKLAAAGVEKPFICPILNASQAALRRMDIKMGGDVVKWAEGGGSIITFKGI